MLTDNEKTVLLDAHNKYRSLVATGKALPGLGGQQLPTASDMAEMVGAGIFSMNSYIMFTMHVSGVG